MDDTLRKDVLVFQREEITGARLYAHLARTIHDKENSKVLGDMALAEGRHYEFWKTLSGIDVPPYHGRLLFFYLAARVLGLTFALKLAEKGEHSGREGYRRMAHLVPEAARIGEEEETHEDALLGMIEEERLAYVGSIVLGLNDALVELTGALAGLTFAFQKGSVVAVSGIITGVAAAFSMAASAYLAAKADGDPRAKKSAIYTGVAYFFTVVLLVLPYLILPQTGGWIYASLGLTLLIAVGIIAGFNYYLSIAKDQDFRSRFFEMAGLSLGVAVLSFLVGLLVRSVFGAEL